MKIIIITGPSGSGKTSLAKKIMAKLENCHIISTDDFYKTGHISNICSFFVQSYFDRKISLNRKLITKTINKILKNKEINYSYKYDFLKKTTEITYKKISCIRYLIIEGIFTLELLKLFSINKYLLIRLKVNKDVCIKRITERDYIERGKSKIKSMENFKNAWKIYENKEKAYKISEKGKELIFKKGPNINTILEEII